MQINGYKKNPENIESINNRVGITARGQNEEERFDSLLKSLQQGEPGEKDLANEQNTDRMAGQNGSLLIERDSKFTKSKAESINIHAQESGKPQTAEEVPVRGITYEQCDGMEINVLEGYTLKAKLDIPKTKDGAEVYVEAKYDDGRMKAYLLGEEGIVQHSSNPIEKIASEIFSMHFKGGR